MRKLRGFTLIELLIVVAIIGVLATVGQPTYRRLLQKAKTAEAKSSLGGLATAESLFYAEYGVYGNNLPKIGFEFDGGQFRYLHGFPTPNCATGIFTPTTFPEKGELQKKFSTYYDSGSTMAGKVGAYVSCYAGIAEPHGLYYTGVSQGVIAPGLNTNAPKLLFDVWQIDQNRILAHVQDGIQ